MRSLFQREHLAVRMIDAYLPMLRCFGVRKRTRDTQLRKRVAIFAVIDAPVPKWWLFASGERSSAGRHS